VTPSDLAKLTELEEEATPAGKGWTSVEIGDRGEVWSGPVEQERGCARALDRGTFTVCALEPDDYCATGDDEDAALDQAIADAKLIAAARNPLPELLAIAEAHLKLTSALEYLERRTFPLRSLMPEVMYQQAYEHGWTWPANEEAKEPDDG